MDDSKSLVTIKDQRSWEEALEDEMWASPRVDISEDEEKYCICVNLPGVSRENIKMRLDNGYLIVMGRIDYQNMLNQNYILKEIESGNFHRRFKLSPGVDESKIEASLTNGLLKIIMPKNDWSKFRNIEIR